MGLRGLLLTAALLRSWGQRASLSFLLIGDWGGIDDLRPSSKGQRHCAKGMGRVGEDLDAGFVLGLGDNFYEDGIHSHNGCRLQTTFENVFTAASLDVDWYIVAGNHDHDGHIDNQIGFTQKSSRWKFPAAYYNFIKRLPSGKVAEFIMLDSVILAGRSYRDSVTGEFVAAPGPENASAAERQWAWLESRLASSRAEYLFVAAHYPVWSVCSHGPTPDLVERLRPLMARHNVTAYLSGHDHCLMHIEEPDASFVLSGAGAQAWYRATNINKIKPAELLWHMARDNQGSFVGGFASITLTDTAAMVSYHGDDGTQLYTAALRPPRSHLGRGHQDAMISI